MRVCGRLRELKATKFEFSNTSRERGPKKDVCRGTGGFQSEQQKCFLRLVGIKVIDFLRRLPLDLGRL